MGLPRRVAAVWMGRVMASGSPTLPPSKALVFCRRFGSTLLLWGLVGLAFWSMKTWAYLGLIALLTVVGTREWSRMAAGAGLRCCGRLGTWLAVIYCAGLHAALAGAWQPWAGWELALVGLALCGAFMVQLREPVRGTATLTEVALALAGFVYVAVLFNYSAKLLFFLPEWRQGGGVIATPAAFLVLWLVAVTKFSDMGAYLTGSLVGRHKMIPHISPGKTWEGFAGGLAFSQLAACGLFALFPQHLTVLGGWGHVLLLGLVPAVPPRLRALAGGVGHAGARSQEGPPWATSLRFGSW